jgi:hypothetical protein
MEILSADEVMTAGLCISGWDVNAQLKWQRSSRVEWFSAMFGSMPVVYAAIWEDFLDSDDPPIRLTGDQRTLIGLHSFLRSMFLLTHYPTCKLLAVFFRVGLFQAKGDVIWYWIRKVHNLKEKKIVWPERWNNPNSEMFIITVDGVHCRIREPGHNTWSKNPKYYSHKNKCAGFNYELGISIFQNALVWLTGEHLSSKHDLTTFREDGLKDVIPDGKKVVADQGYRGDEVGAGLPISTPCSHDSELLRTFKSRARARHETFNGRIKNFKILAETFRHKKELHVVAFTACCVIVQYQMEHGSPLMTV